eukprot:TRINITY_DN115128_c0_g1_i1.p1 TRINITY_DN115128_c0_g1~~TRINITY_DN115128_c0_g1_i1.p1  ORF type:complete len:461 (+),score=98.52 TRINITY_DN115128_c0_g1_i1:109-1491(+)
MQGDDGDGADEEDTADESVVLMPIGAPSAARNQKERPSQNCQHTGKAQPKSAVVDPSVQGLQSSRPSSRPSSAVARRAELLEVRKSVPGLSTPPRPSSASRPGSALPRSRRAGSAKAKAALGSEVSVGSLLHNLGSALQGSGAAAARAKKRPGSAPSSRQRPASATTRACPAEISPYGWSSSGRGVLAVGNNGRQPLYSSMPRPASAGRLQGNRSSDCDGELASKPVSPQLTWSDMEFRMANLASTVDKCKFLSNSTVGISKAMQTNDSELRKSLKRGGGGTREAMQQKLKQRLQQVSQVLAHQREDMRNSRSTVKQFGRICKMMEHQEIRSKGPVGAEAVRQRKWSSVGNGPEANIIGESQADLSGTVDRMSAVWSSASKPSGGHRRKGTSPKKSGRSAKGDTADRNPAGPLDVNADCKKTGIMDDSDGSSAAAIAVDTEKTRTVSFGDEVDDEAKEAT